MRLFDEGNQARTPMKRREAERLGLDRYWTGKPCKYGHSAERDTERGDCLACREERSSRDTLPLRHRLPKLKDYNCVRCGSAFKSYQSKASYCSKDCMSSDMRESRKLPPKLCKTCGIPITTGSRARLRRREYCSKHISVNRTKVIKANKAARDAAFAGLCDVEANPPLKQCICGAMFAWTGAACSTECWLVVLRIAKDKRRKDKSERAKPTNCATCGKPFVPGYKCKTPRYCSPECSAKVFKRASKHKRRAVAKGAQGSHRADDVHRIMAMQRSRCACCGVRVGARKEYHVDHIEPLARGGSNGPRNLQILCARCNLEKGFKDPIEFMQSRGRLL
jgi:5-methylcytosine-specific restriction endonuclease McrA